MLETIVALICLFGTIALLFFKMFNITNILKDKPIGGYKGLIFSFIGILLFWGLYFLSFAASLQFVETTTTGAEVSIITTSSFVGFSLFLQAMNFFLLLGIMLTVGEVLALFSAVTKNGGRR